MGTGCRASSGYANASHGVSSRDLAPGGYADYSGAGWVILKSLPAILAIGASNTRFGGMSLPLDLGRFGATGCSVYNDWIFTVGGTTFPSYLADVRFNLSFPEDPTLVGSKHYSQIYVLDPMANALGVFTTNGTESTLGAGPGITTIAGQPSARSGGRAPQYGLSIGLD